MSFTPPRLRQIFEQASRFRQAGYGAEADRLFRQILQTPAGSGDDFYLQGNTLMQMGRIAEAATLFDHALESGPVTAELLVDRGVALAELGRFEDAAASCERAVALRPDFAHAHFILGDCLRELTRFEAAMESFDKALALEPDYIPVLMNRSAILVTIMDFERALADFDRLVRLRPNDPVILNGRGQVLGEMFRWQEALVDLNQALTLNPAMTSALHNRGVVLWNLERFDEALANYERALQLNPNLLVTMSNRANALQDVQRLEEAMAVHDRVIALNPEFASGHWNRSQGLLLRGHWAEGLAEFEWRRKRPESAGHYLTSDKPEWLGLEDLSGKTLYVRAEQGLGDSLQFSRYLAMAQARGAKVIFSVHDALMRLMETLEPPVEIMPYRATPPKFDYHIPMMSMLLAFGTTLDNIPAPIPYLKAEPERIRDWAAKLGTNGFKIGVSWRGGGRGKSDVGRTYPIAGLAGLARLPGVRLISLQKGAEALAQLADLPHGMTVETLTDFDEGKNAFLDTAAVMENLDLVISSDTAVAHLAGALGRPTWLALKYVPEWRWQLQGDTTPWYPTMRLFRQQAVGKWDGVFAQMDAALAKELAQ